MTVVKVGLASAGGILLPVAVEELSKGARIKSLKNIKASALTGLTLGAISLGAVAVDEMGWAPLGLTDEDKYALTAFGTPCLVLGAYNIVKEKLGAGTATAGLAAPARVVVRVPEAAPSGTSIGM